MHNYVSTLSEKIRHLQGPDLKMKEYFRSKVRDNLADAGELALSKGEIGKIINLQVREKYRNPPAHTRFLPLSILLSQ